MVNISPNHAMQDWQIDEPITPDWLNTVDGVLVKEGNFVLKNDYSKVVGYGTTAGSGTSLNVIIDGVDANGLKDMDMIRIRLNVSLNWAANWTLSVNSGAAKPVFNMSGSNLERYLAANTVLMLVYNATQGRFYAVGVSNSDQKETQNGDGVKTVYALTTMSYIAGQNTLTIYIDGIKQQLSTAYTETNSTSVTFTEAPPNGSVVEFLTRL